MSGIRINTGGAASRRETMEDIIAEMNAMVGLTEVKTQLNAFMSLSKLMVLRRDRDLPSIKTNLHMVFSGPPGTGKTVVARKVGRMLKSIRLLKVGDCVEVDRSNLVAPYVGQTATKTRDVIEKALDSVLFIDEAYTLSDQGPDRDPFGQEAIDTLLRLMENYRERLVVIVAGYGDKMHSFIRSNPGLESRFSRTIMFDAYNADELTVIFENLITDNKMVLDEAGRRTAQRAVKDLWNMFKADPTFGNARVIRGMFERVVTAQAERLALAGNIEGLSDEDLQTLTEDDVRAGFDQH